MSDNIPFEIQMDIIQRIPDTKSVIQFRSVSKAWKSVIDSNKFVNAHTLRLHHHHHHHHHLLIRTQDSEDCKECTGTITSGRCDNCDYTPVKYFSIVDDDTFPHQKSSVFVPDSVDKFRIDGSKILGTCHGLLCLYEREMSAAVIWNPSIRKTVSIAVPNNVVSKRHLPTVVGFGVCPRKLDPKLVKITFVEGFGRLQDDENTSTQVEVFTLLSSGGTWRSPLSGNLCDNPHLSITNIWM